MDNFSLILHFFFQEKLRFSYHWKCKPIKWLHAQSYLQLQLSYKNKWIFLSGAILWSRHHKMADTIMTFEFGTIHLYSSLVKNSEACVLHLFKQMKTYMKLYKILTFWLRIIMFSTATWISFPLYACLACFTKTVDYFTFRRILEIFFLQFVNCESLLSFNMIN